MSDTRATSLLPPTATPAQRAIEAAMRADIDYGAMETVLDPMQCPEEVLPFLASQVSISHWDTSWTVAEKRAAVAAAFAFHKIKGTRAAVEQVLERFHPDLFVVEWWQANPPRRPHSFEVRANALEVGPDFFTIETAEAIIRDVAAAKPLRAHFDYVQSLESRVSLYLSAGGAVGSIARADYAAGHDQSRDWSAILQTEDGEPIRTENGADFLEHS